jgi:hypothetical protein
MGAALTYARRYALFTLVGIAGEDDLDAPDLPLQSVDIAPLPPVDAPSLAPSSASPTAARTSKLAKPPLPTLSPNASLIQRNALLAELTSISTFDGAAEWAKRIIPLKNTLIPEHARDVEVSHEIKMTEVWGMVEERPAPSKQPSRDPGDGSEWLATADRSTLTFGHRRAAATRLISGLLPPSPAWSAAANPPMRIT